MKGAWVRAGTRITIKYVLKTKRLTTHFHNIHSVPFYIFRFENYFYFVLTIALSRACQTWAHCNAQKTFLLLTRNNNKPCYGTWPFACCFYSGTLKGLVLFYHIDFLCTCLSVCVYVVFFVHSFICYVIHM